MAASQHQRARRDVIQICRQMNASGINQGTSGNVSCRIGDAVLISPSGIAYDDLAPRMIVEMDLEDGYRGNYLPSSEWRMHLDIYKQRREALAVVHTHSAYASALSCLRQTIPAFHYMIAAAGGTTLRCADYATFGTAELSDNMMQALDGRQACLLANHEVIAFGPNLDKALWLAGEIETLCKQYWAARQVGEPVILDDAEMDKVIGKFATYGRQIDDMGDNEHPAFDLPARRDKSRK